MTGHNGPTPRLTSNATLIIACCLTDIKSTQSIEINDLFFGERANGADTDKLLAKQAMCPT